MTNLTVMKKLQKNLKRVFAHSDTKDSFHNAVLFGLVFKLSKNSVVNEEFIKQVLGKEFFDVFKKKEFLQLDVSFCNFEKNVMLQMKFSLRKSIFTGL